LCRCAARVVARLDRRQQLALLPLADDEASVLLASIPEDERMECWWLVLRDGTPVAGNKGGGVAILSELRLTRPFGLLLRVLRLSELVDILDDGFARHRATLGRFVPDGEAPHRYP
jgi:predicted DCC family thiol-disulfide oxidoreductase YuxK